MRVALVAPFLDLGGSTTYLCSLGGELRRRGIPVIILSLLSRNPLRANFEEAGIPLVAQDERRLAYDERLAGTVAELQKFSPTVVIAWGLPPSFEVLRYVPQGILRIAMLQNDVPDEFDEAKHYAPFADLFVGVSQRVIDHFREVTQLRDVTAVYLPSGVRMPAMPTPRQLQPDQPVRVLYLGRLHQSQKRVRLFPEIYRALLATGIPFVWTIAGDGPERSYLEREMQAGTTHQRVAFIGAVPFSQVNAVLAKQDVFVLASDYEGMPLSLLEAMAQGLVPVVSRIPSGIPEIVDESTGRLVDVDNTTGYATEIAWLYRHPEELAVMSGCAIRRIRERFSVEALTTRWLDLISAHLKPTSEADWPERIRIRPPLVHPHRWSFILPFRYVRRLFKRVRAARASI
jgi:glycosyltransferase involved in cell wall biosynthesis